jgi:hypothetical protein
LNRDEADKEDGDENSRCDNHFVHIVLRKGKNGRKLYFIHNKKSGDALEALYKPLNTPLFRTDLKTAERIKYASTCMLATKSSYWNKIVLCIEHRTLILTLLPISGA